MGAGGDIIKEVQQEFSKADLSACPFAYPRWHLETDDFFLELRHFSVAPTGFNGQCYIDGPWAAVPASRDTD
jgi:hypothetical protein